MRIIFVAETARALHETNAHLFLAVRDVARGKEVAQEIQTNGHGKANIDVLPLELDSLESVKSCAAEFLKRSQTLNILVNNAGARLLLQRLPNFTLLSC